MTMDNAGHALASEATVVRRSVLVVGLMDEDYQSLERLLRRWNCRVHRAHTCVNGVKVLDRSSVALVICDEELPDGHWTMFLSGAVGQSDPPLLVVAARVAESPILEHVRNAEGYDLLLKPFEPDEVHLVITAGIRRWHERRSARGAAGAG